MNLGSCYNSLGQLKRQQPCVVLLAYFGLDHHRASWVFYPWTSYWIPGFAFTTDSRLRRRYSYPSCDFPFSFSFRLLQTKAQNGSGFDPLCCIDGHCRRHRLLLHEFQHQIWAHWVVHAFDLQEYYCLDFLCTHKLCCWCKHCVDCCGFGLCFQLRCFLSLIVTAAQRCQCLDLHIVYSKCGEGCCHIHCGFQEHSNCMISEDFWPYYDNYWNFAQHFGFTWITMTHLGLSDYFIIHCVAALERFDRNYLKWQQISSCIFRGFDHFDLAFNDLDFEWATLNLRIWYQLFELEILDQYLGPSANSCCLHLSVSDLESPKYSVNISMKAE